ncbi:MAG: hypothetical protein ABSA02_33700 [Trebonia sp.]|jgi:hypothetical protein
MIFIKAHKQRLRLAGALAVAVAALTVTACGGGNAAASAQGAAPGHWSAAEVSQFTAAAVGKGDAGQESCVIRYVKQDMSFGNAMAIAAVDPPSDSSMTPAQIQAAVVSKYGTASGNAINAQFGQAVTDAGSNCDGQTAPSSAPAAAPAPTADPAATSESSCTVDCVDPVASGESGWLAQVQVPLQNVQQDLSSISSDASGDPSNLALDGTQLEEDAQAALNLSNDPPPADNADWVTAMNDYVTAGQDYYGDNMNEQDDTPAQASQEIAAANSALAGFNAANGGVLNGIIQS